GCRAPGGVLRPGRGSSGAGGRIRRWRRSAGAPPRRCPGPADGRRARRPRTPERRRCVPAPRAPAAGPRASWVKFVHDLDDGADVLRRGVRQNAVTEIEDVAGAGAGALEQFDDLLAQLGERREQGRRVEVALDGGAVADFGPGLVDIDAP